MATPLMQEFPELSDLTREDLEDMLSDPLYFQSKFFTLARVKAILDSQTELGAANEAIAKKNLALQDELFRLRAETQAAFDEAKALQGRWKEVEKEQKDVYARLDPSFLLMRLKHSATAQDELSENLASAFVLAEPSGTNTPVAPGEHGSGSAVDVDRFVKEFKEMRKVYHKRMIWSERWTNGKVAWRDD